jgi:protoporphyrinogen oxidase
MFAETLIIGSGFTGLCTAYHMQDNQQNFVIVDKTKPGYIARTNKVNDYFFDLCGHVIHHCSKPYEDFIHRVLGKNLLEHERRTYFSFEKKVLPYPFQTYFYKIPQKDIVTECISGLETAVKNPILKNPTNFKDWMIEKFGPGICKYLMEPYNEKMWQFPLKEISLEWVDRFVPNPNINRLLELAKSNGENEKAFCKAGYNPVFFYPKHGGIQAFLDSIKSRINEKDSIMEGKVQKISLNEKNVTLSNGKKISWNKIVSTIPLNSLMKLIVPSNSPIEKKDHLLRHTSLLSINLGIKGEASTDAHWIYYPEKKIPFHRIVFQSNLSPNVSPQSTYSIIVEMSLDSKKRVDSSFLINQIISELLNQRIIKNKQDIQEINPNFTAYAYPIYDHSLFENRKHILSFLEKNRILSIGRFGSWEYLSLEDCFNQSISAGEKIKVLG